MAHTLVKILTSDDGEPNPEHRLVWHWIMSKGGNHTLCEGEYFGAGESGCEYELKRVERGGITCPECLSTIKEIKSIKL